MSEINCLKVQLAVNSQLNVVAMCVLSHGPASSKPIWQFTAESLRALNREQPSRNLLKLLFASHLLAVGCV